VPEGLPLGRICLCAVFPVLPVPFGGGLEKAPFGSGGGRCAVAGGFHGGNRIGGNASAECLSTGRVAVQTIATEN